MCPLGENSVWVHYINTEFLIRSMMLMLNQCCTSWATAWNLKLSLKPLHDTTNVCRYRSCSLLWTLSKPFCVSKCISTVVTLQKAQQKQRTFAFRVKVPSCHCNQYISKRATLTVTVLHTSHFSVSLLRCEKFEWQLSSYQSNRKVFFHSITVCNQIYMSNC